MFFDDYKIEYYRKNYSDNLKSNYDAETYKNFFLKSQSVDIKTPSIIFYYFFFFF